MLVWEAAAILEKNKLASDAPFLVLLKIEHTKLTDPIYLARNTEDVEWNGKTFVRFPFNFSQMTTDSQTIPTVDLTVSNCGGLIQSYLQQYNGLADAKVTMYLVHENLLTRTEALMTIEFSVNSVSYDESWITFKLGCSPELNFKFPLHCYMSNYCPFRFKDIRCGYTGTASACNNTRAECRIPSRFGGEQGMVGNYA